MRMNKDQVWEIKEVAQYLQKFPETNDDRFIGVSGREGVGKSVLSLLITLWLWKLRGKDKDWYIENLKNMLFYHRKRLIQNLEESFDGVFIDDEAVREFNRTFYKKDQIEYVKMTKVIRFHRHIVFKNIPILWELDPGLRKRIAIYIWVKIKPLNGRPGLAYLFQREEGAFVTDPWNVKDNQKLERQRRIYTSPNYYGMIKIPNYGDKPWFKRLELEYNRIKEEDKKGAYGDESGSYIDPITIAEVFLRIQDAGAMKYNCQQELANAFNISYSHFRNVLSDVRKRNNKTADETSTTVGIREEEALIINKQGGL